MTKNKISLSLLGIAITFLISVLSGSCFANSQNIVFLKKLSVPPVINGKLDDQCWKDAVKINNLRLYNKTGQTPAKVKTSVYIGYDDNNLYLGFHCEGSITKTHQLNRDSKIWAEDHIEVFISINRDLENYYLLGVNAIGTQTDVIFRGGLSSYPNWNGPWQSVVFKGNNFWSVEIALPFKSLAVSAPKLGEMWGMELGRYTVSEKEWSSWHNSFHKPGTFGFLIFGTYSEALTSRLKTITKKTEIIVRNNEKSWEDKINKIEASLLNLKLE